MRERDEFALFISMPRADHHIMMMNNKGNKRTMATRTAKTIEINFN